MDWKSLFVRSLISHLGRACLLFTLSFTGAAQTVEKVADLEFATADGVGIGGYEPLVRPVQVGTNLWYTTDRGGTFDAGTVSRFDLVTQQVVQVASFDNDTGKGSESALLVIGEDGYFTTKSGGTGNAGTIARINLTTGSLQVLFNFPENSATNRNSGIQIGSTPRASLTRIGDELWATTSLGGTANRGSIVRYNLTNGTVRLVAHLDGPLLGSQAFGGFTPGDDQSWYFTTFTGGTTFGTAGLPLGAGTVGRLTFDNAGEPVLTRIADLAAGHTQFPGLEPTKVGSSLYFGTTGPNSSPGAIVRLDLDTGNWTNLFSFTTNAASAEAFGTRPGYSGLVEWQGDLYFLTRQGGRSNLGTIARYSIAANAVTKLADFDGIEGLALGRATAIFDNTGTIVELDGRSWLYYLLPAGGLQNRGTIVRVALPGPRLVATLQLGPTGDATLAWTGGTAPFTVESRENATDGTWTPVATGLTDRRFTVTPTAASGFFRVLGSP